MIIKGDALTMPIRDNSVDAIVTDPPYGLEFMGKEWDSLGAKFRKQSENDIKRGQEEKHICGRFRLTMPDGYKAGKSMQLWHTQWLTEAYRVLKPGGSMLVMGGTRTSHRLACAIEDTGFIIKDTILWIFGSGFPKCQDITPMIDGKVLGITTKQVKERREKIGIDEDFLKRNPRDNSDGIYESGLKDGLNGAIKTKPLTPEAKHWDGFKVGGIKPAYEPIIWAVKPPEGSYVDNVLKWGVGAVNVDETRINVDNDEPNKRNNPSNSPNTIWNNPYTRGATLTKGRFPTNVILSHHPECVQVGMKKVKGLGGSGRASEKGHGFQTEYVAGNKKTEGFSGGFVDKDGYEQVESWDCHTDCPIRLLDEQSGVLGNAYRPNRDRNKPVTPGIFGGDKLGETYPDNGGASRFYYCAKASKSERNAGLEGMPEKECFNLGHKDNPGRNAPKKSYPRQNNHPTVKPIKLFEWLIKLVTREGQIVLDPFIGSGTTAIAAHKTGRKCIGIEKEGEYLEIAKRRIRHWESQPTQMEMRV